MFVDDEDFIPGPSSNLASLFEKRTQEDSPSLTYTAPKQPFKGVARPSKPSAAASNLVDLVLFKSVEAYKLENGTYQNYGKAGVAVLANEETRLYQILLYRDKLHHLCSAKINVQFKFLNQANNYATFYDKHNHVWSVLFSNDEDAIEFSIQVVLAKYNSEDKASLISQDLWLPLDDNKGTVSSVGTTVEFQYTLYNQEQLNKLIETNKTGKMCAKTDTVGWQQELQNLYKGSQRLLIIPCANLGEWKSVVPTCPVLFVKLSVLKVIDVLIEPIQLPQIEEKQLPVLQYDNSDHSNEEATVKARGVSIKDTLSNSPKTAKAKLISRMARMGQATLPIRGATATATPSDSDDTEEDQRVNTKGQDDARPELKPRIHNNQSIVQSIPSTVLRSQQPAQWPPYMMGPMYPQVISSPSDSSLPVFFSEIRTHNSELRMGITRVTDKMDTVLSKLESNTTKPDNETLLSVVDRLTQDNSVLKKQLEQLEDNYQQLQDQNKQIIQLLCRLKETVVQSNTPNGLLNNEESKELTKLLTESQADLSHVKEKLSGQQKINEELKLLLKHKNEELEKATTLHESEHKEEKIVQENDMLALKEKYEKQLTEMINSLKKAEDNVSILEDSQKEMAELNNELVLSLQNHEETVNKLKETNDAFISTKKELTELLTQKNTEVRELEISLKKHESMIEELKLQLVQEKNKADSSEDIKTVMNIAYRHLKAQFEAGSMYDTATIHTVLVDTIKAVTYQYLQSDAVLKGDGNKHENRTVVKSSQNETKVTRSGKQEEPQGHNESQSTVASSGGYKTKEERDHMKFSLAPPSSHSAVDKKSLLEGTNSQVTIDKKSSSESTNLYSTVKQIPDVLPIVTGEGDVKSNSQKTEISTGSEVKTSQGPHGDDDDAVGDASKHEKKTHQNESKEASSSKHEEEKSVQSQVYSDNQNENISKTPLPREYKTKEDRDQMKLSLAPESSHFDTDKNLHSNVNKIGIPDIVHNVSSESALPLITGEGDIKAHVQNTETSTGSEVKTSRGQQGEDEDSADDIWQPKPPPPPNFDEDDSEDDWFNN